MIDALDNTLRHLFLSVIPGITTEAQVRFQPPDDTWRTDVVNLNQMALNVYLIELRENRRLRSNARRFTTTDGDTTSHGVPRQLDCHYLITAWSPANPGPAVEPTVEEHLLLYQVTGALMQADPIQPRKIFAPSPPPPGYPHIFLDEELPTAILPPEGFPKYAEFWGTMTGNHHPWKPCVYCVITLPVVMESRQESRMVTTRITDYRQTTSAGLVEAWAEIGGIVIDTTVVPAVPVADAWVAIYDTSGQQLATTSTDSQGRFIFNLLRPGNYQLRFGAVNRAATAPRNITIPSPTGEYNLQFV